jgi:hypothetical protein
MSILSQFWPVRDDPARINPADIFQIYEDAILGMEQGSPSADDSKLLAQSWKIFDNEGARRTTIDSRAAAMMPAISLAATLVTGVGFTVLKDESIPVLARCIILASFLLALLYLVRTMVLLFKIHGKVFRSTLDPSDLPPPVSRARTSPYDRKIACKILRYTVANYKVNNIQTDTLFVAQHAFRNAIIVIVLGGAVAGIVIFHNLMAAPANPLLPGFRFLLSMIGSQAFV